MAPVLEQLDREWVELARSSRGRRALTRWAQRHPALQGIGDLDALLEARRDPTRAPALLAALAVLAPDDQLAARTLLQALVPGLIRLARSTGNDDPAALVELVSIAWERIRTYPQTRNGSVAANVLLDTRKRYRQHRLIANPRMEDLIAAMVRHSDVGATPPEEMVRSLDEHFVRVIKQSVS